MKMNYSLMTILRNDPDFAGAFAKEKIESVKKDKKNLLKTAESYTEKYRQEIEEGTKLRQKLLTEGEASGKTEDEVLSCYGKFIPAVYTPILNWLFFTFREEADAPKTSKMQLEELIKYYIEKFGYEDFIKRLEEGSTYVHETYSENLEDILSDETNDPPSSDSFIYGNMDHKTFKTIKKLKALSTSTNEVEAFAAYRKCIEMCRKFGLEFDKIPSKH